MTLRKDKSLDELARVGNVAQFVSYSPGRAEPHQEFSRVAGFDANHQFQDLSEGLRALLDQCPEGTLNLRSFTPDNPRSRDFHYGLADLAQIEALVRKMSGEGLYVIANETVDVADGGVSGVIQGGVVEFAPDDTPRCVEKGGTALALLASAVVAGCASSSSEIAPAYVSPVAYQSFTCQQLAQEVQAVSQRAAMLSGAQDKQRTNDGLATAAAVVVFWPAAFFVGGDKQTAAELANMKGQMVAIEQAANAKRCGIQFQGPRPPGT